MKKLLLLTLFIIAFSFAAEKKTYLDNQSITLETNFSKTYSLSNAITAKFLFSPVEGIHVNTNPEFEFVLEKKSLFEVSGKSKFSSDAKGYLETKKPVEFLFKGKKKLAPGKYLLKGKLNYFYCSDTEGWCNRFSQEIELNIEITK